jgi:hypothetical protein
MADWRADLNSFFEEDKQAETKKEAPFSRFIRLVGVPAFEQVKTEFEQHGRQGAIRQSEATASICISYGGSEEMTYALKERLLPNGPLPIAEVRAKERNGLKLVTIESMVRSGTDYTLDDVTEEHVIQHVIQQYMNRVKPRQV